jgi:hypothetical protein
MKESFEDYLQRLKDRRTEDSYKYTDEDFIQYQEYIKDCCKSGMSVYKCLEFMYFAEKDMDDQLFNRQPKQELKKNFYCGDEVDYDDKCLEQCENCNDATGVDYGHLPKEIHLEDVFNDEKKEGIKKLIQKQKLIDMMEQDEQLGLYQETECDCGLELDCKDCSQSLQDCTCIEDTIDMKQSTKDRILSETSEEIKQRVRETANKLVMKQETLEEHNYLQGFIKQFDPNEGEINGEDWTAVHFLRWLGLNKFKIIK